MFSTKLSKFQGEIAVYLMKGGTVSELPEQDNPGRISAQTRQNLEDEDEENIIADLGYDGFGFYIGRREK